MTLARVGLLMDKTDLIRKLSEKRYAHFESLGLPPFKCRQLATDKLASWKEMPTEELERLLEEGEAEY